MFGEIESVTEGQIFESRRELHDANVHNGLMRGIGKQGASIVLSGGYVDDEDLGDEIIYTGEGGRDSNTGLQVGDQTLTKGNKFLEENYRLGNPIRVIRGSQQNLLIPRLLATYILVFTGLNRFLVLLGPMVS